MHIHITPHHLTLTSPMRLFTNGKIAALTGIIREIVAAHVVLRLDSRASPERRFCARVRLAVRGNDVFASGTDGNLYAAINQVADKLACGLVKRKTRGQARHKRRQRAGAWSVA